MPRLFFGTSDALFFLSGISWILLSMYFITLLLKDPITLAKSCNPNLISEPYTYFSQNPNLLPLPDLSYYLKHNGDEIDCANIRIRVYDNSIKLLSYTLLQQFEEMSEWPDVPITLIGILEPEELLLEFKVFLKQLPALLKTLLIWQASSLLMQ
jgi:hypothetical protein